MSGTQCREIFPMTILFVFRVLCASPWTIFFLAPYQRHRLPLPVPLHLQLRLCRCRSHRRPLVFVSRALKFTVLSSQLASGPQSLHRVLSIFALSMPRDQCLNVDVPFLVLNFPGIRDLFKPLNHNGPNGEQCALLNGHPNGSPTPKNISTLFRQPSSTSWYPKNIPRTSCEYTHINTIKNGNLRKCLTREYPVI